jgi:hypothetical protein
VPSERLDYESILAGMEAERAALDTAIAGLRAYLNKGTTDPLSGPGGPTVLAKPIDPSMIRDDAFFGLSIGEAAKKYLTLVKRKQSVREIAEALERGGLPHTSSNFVNTVGTMLNRAAINDAELVRVGRGEWGLSGWYGNRRPKPEPPKKSKRAKPVKASKPIGPRPEGKPRAHDGPTVHQLAANAIKEAGKPIPIGEILERIAAASGRHVKKDTLAAVFSVATRKGDTFVKVSPSVFGLL